MTENTMDGTLLPLFYARDQDDFGIGDIRSLIKAVELHASLGQNLVEILPVTMSSAFESPYSVLSSRLMDPVYISVSLLLKDLPSPSADAWIASHADQVKAIRQSRTVEYERVRKVKSAVFRRVYSDFSEKGSSGPRCDFEAFRRQRDDGLEDHVLYVILRRFYLEQDPRRGWDFRSWPEAVRCRHPETIRSLKRKHAVEIEFEMFLQWVFQRQWRLLLHRAEKLGVRLMGDIPFSVDGADLWIHPGIFGLEPPEYRRDFTQGVPPDCFSRAGQYWQFYPYDWKNAKTEEFLLERFRWHQDWFNVIRLDHVLGYYRGYLFYEDPGHGTTLRSLGIWEAVKRKIREARADPKREEALAWETYTLMLDAMDRHMSRWQPEFSKRFFADRKAYRLKQHHMLLVARSSPENRPREPWLRYHSVEKAVFEDSPSWDFMKLSGSEGYQDRSNLAAYLFARGRNAPSPEDSLRPCLFQDGPGEDLIKAFLQEARHRSTVVITEALGVVPEFVVASLSRMKAINYIPLIYGMTPWDPSNPYFPSNHEKNAFVTFALHDSRTLKSWWKTLEPPERSAILEYLFEKGRPENSRPRGMTRTLQKKILSEVYRSPAGIKVILWTDLFLSGDREAINKPGSQGNQWISRMPRDADLDALLKASRGKKSTPRAHRTVSLIRQLRKVRADRD